jgi:hypothetical protein
MVERSHRVNRGSVACMHVERDEDLLMCHCIGCRMRTLS